MFLLAVWHTLTTLILLSRFQILKLKTMARSTLGTSSVTAPSMLPLMTSRVEVSIERALTMNVVVVVLLPR